MMTGAFRKFAVILGLTVCMLAVQTGVARACCTCWSRVNSVSDSEWFDQYPRGTVDVVTTAIHNEINAHESWLVKFLFEDNILPAMQLMAEQLTVVALQQVEIVGAFFDAKHQLESQRILQKFQAEAHKDYHPSEGLCEFGSTVKSLAASERRGEYNSILLAQRSMDRNLGNANSSAASGEEGDKSARLLQFIRYYCDPNDNNGGLQALCQGGGGDRTVFNKDIDYARTIDYPWTLKVDYTDPTLETDERDVMALANNLFGHKVFSRVPPEQLCLLPEGNSGSQCPTIGEGGRLRDGNEAFMDMRALVAKRSVAENSFNAIVGMKSEGTGGSTQYLQAILRELGVDNTAQNSQALTKLLGENPSYHAQMEVLTKKIYQNPDFYTNLYDKPANVLRKDAAIQAIGLMQKFDMFKSHLRSEATLSVLLEMAVVELQREVETNIRDSKQGGEAVLVPTPPGN